MTEELSQEVNTDKQHTKQYDWLKQYQWQKGQSGNPLGANKGKKMKTLAAELLAGMSDEEKAKWLKTQSPDFVWRMAEGNPKNDGDLDLTIISKVVSIDE